MDVIQEAKAKVEAGREVTSAADYALWANITLTEAGEKWPFCLSPSGEMFVSVVSGGGKAEGADFPAYFETKEEAVKAWEDAAIKFMGDSPIIYWRTEPEAELLSRGWVVYSRMSN